MKNISKPLLLSVCLFFPAFGSEKKANCCSLKRLCYYCRPDTYFDKKDKLFKYHCLHKSIVQATIDGNLKKVKRIDWIKKFKMHPGQPFAHLAAFCRQEAVLRYFVTKKNLQENHLGLVKFETASPKGPSIYSPMHLQEETIGLKDFIEKYCQTDYLENLFKKEDT